MKISELEAIFSHHAPPTPAHSKAYDLNRMTLYETAVMLTVNTPVCAEQTIGIRKLQEAMFYFNAAIALNPDKLPTVRRTESTTLGLGQ